MENGLKWALGLLGLGGGAFVAKTVFDKQPKIGDVATVQLGALKLQSGLPAAASLPGFGAVGTANLTLPVPVNVSGINGDTLSGIVSPGVPVVFAKTAILSLTRGGKVIK
jgi:hypothetical protein